MIFYVDSNSNSDVKLFELDKETDLCMLVLCNILVQEFGSWQGGINPRFSPANNTVVSIKKLDAAQQRATMELVIARLHGWINYVDTYHGKDEAKDIPEHSI